MKIVSAVVAGVIIGVLGAVMPPPVPRAAPATPHTTQGENTMPQIDNPYALDQTLAGKIRRCAARQGRR
jgi:hypothetical protein